MSSRLKTLARNRRLQNSNSSNHGLRRFGLQFRKLAVESLEDRRMLSVLVSPTSGLTTTEAGGTAAFTLVLDTQPTADVTIGLASSDASEGAVTPASVTFNASNWASPQTVTVTGVDDALADGDVAYSIVTAAASSEDINYNGVNPADVSVTNFDNDIPALTLTIAAASISEDAGTHATTGRITRNTSMAASLNVSLSCSDISEISVPSSVTIPFGYDSATFYIDALDDSILDGTQTVTIYAFPTVSGMREGRATVNVTDNEVPTLKLNLAASSVSEAGGSAATTGTVTRFPVTSSSLVVNLTSSDTTEATVPSSVTIAANQASATFNIAAVDDTLFDSMQIVGITVSATILGTPVSATSPLNVLDNNDAPKLTLTLAKTSVLEGGGPQATTGTVTRNNDTTDPLVVMLSSSDTTEATVPSSVTIPAGQASATFDIAAVDDSLIDGSQWPSISANAVYSGMRAGLDTTFGTLGIVNSLTYELDAFTLQSDDKFVVAGGYRAGSSNRWSISRLNANGSADTSFGTNGRIWDFWGLTDYPEVQKIIVQPDGKILVGISTAVGGTLQLYRYNADGSKDTSFVTMQYNDMVGTFGGMVLLPDGKIFVALGYSVNTRLIRLNADGLKDATFGDNGVVTYTQSYFDPQALLLLSDGRFLLGGNFLNSPLEFMRVNADGTLDVTFGNGGVRTVDIGDGFIQISDIAIDHAGRIVAGGYTCPYLGGLAAADFAAVRLTPDGSLDAAFGGDGIVTTDFPAGLGDVEFSMVIQSDDKIILAGRSNLPNFFGQIGIVRYAVDGSLDATFDRDGLFMNSLATTGIYGSLASNSILQADGKLVVMVYTDGETPLTPLARYQLDYSATVSASATLTVTDDDNPPVSIGNLVWKDSNANGIQDAGEPGVEGVGVELYSTNNGTIGDADDVLLKRLVTNSSGNYVWNSTWSQVNGKQYYLVFRGPAGYAFTQKAAPGSVATNDSDADAAGVTGIFSLSFGQTDATRDAGLVGATPGFGFGLSAGGEGFESGRSTAVDNNTGNVYVTGSFENTVDFDPGPGTYSLTSAGGSDIFVTKYSSAGALLWAKRMGGEGDDEGTAVAMLIGNEMDNICVAGNFSNAAVFGNFNLTSAGGSDVFACSIDSSGNVNWVSRLGGSGDDRAHAMAESYGGLCITGSFENTVSNSNLVSAGGGDIFVWALTKGYGTTLFAYGMGGPGDDCGTSVAFDYNNCVYVAGYFSATADFNPASGTLNLTSAGGYDIFVAKYEAWGYCLWADRMGGTGDDRAQAIAWGWTQNGYAAFITGDFENSVDFNPGTPVHELTSAGSKDIFVASLDQEGNFSWACRMGGAGSDSAADVDFASDQTQTGYIYTTGNFAGTVDFDPGDGVFNMTAVNSDIFVSRFDTTGKFVSCRRIGGAEDDFGRGVEATIDGTVYVTGDFRGTADFDPSVNEFPLTSAGSGDFFLSKFLPINAPTNIALTAVSVAENQPIGTVIGSFSCVDRDSGETIAYSLVSGPGSTDNALFSIDASGRLVTAAILDFETKATYRIFVRATDYSGMSSLKYINITATDLPETFAVGEANWTAAGVTVKIGSDGKLHAYQTGTVINAVPPHNPAKVTGIEIAGRGLSDILTVESLGTGIPSLLVRNATLNVTQGGVISAGIEVTIDGGFFNYDGPADLTGNLTLLNGGTVGVASINNPTTTVVSGTLTAGSIVCDTLTIGSPGDVSSVDTVETQAADIPSTIEKDIATSTTVYAATTSAMLNDPQVAERSKIDPGREEPDVASSAVFAPQMADVSLLGPSAVPTLVQTAAAIPIAASVQSPMQIERRNISINIAKPLTDANPGIAIHAVLDFSAGTASGLIQPIGKLAESIWGELADSLAGTIRQPSITSASRENIHRLALQSLIHEYAQNSAIEPLDSVLLVSKNFRKQANPALKAIDEFHSELASLTCGF